MSSTPLIDELRRRLGDAVEQAVKEVLAEVDRELARLDEPMSKLREYLKA